MTVRRVLIAMASLWEVARFFLFISFLATRLSPEVPGALASVPWLLAASGSGLVIPAAGLLYALLPNRYAAFLGLLRLAKAIGVATVLLLFLTGAVAPATEVLLVEIGRLPITRSTVAFGLILCIDIAFLAALFSRGDRP